jgi:uncharacterized protein (DUF983 family)
MKVTRAQILARGLTHRCPNCGAPSLFRPGTLFQIQRSCPRCGLPFERDEGGFLGAMSLNYGVTVVGILLPILALHLAGVLSGRVAVAAAATAAVLVPAVLYRSSRSWWLMNYYVFLPHHLPANRTEPAAGGDDDNT